MPTLRLTKNIKILMALPFPPPYSGYEKMSEIIYNSDLPKKFSCTFIDTSNKGNNNSVRGFFSFYNLIQTLKIFVKINFS